MAYIGREPSFGAFERQTITPDGSTTTFTLNFTVGSSSSILVSVAGVVQDPTGAYGISEGGTKIVFTAAPASGDTVFIIFLGIALDSAALISSSTITSQTDLTTGLQGADSILLHDSSASGLKEVTLANLVTGQTDLTTGLQGADELLLFDNSATDVKKVNLDNLIIGQTALTTTADDDVFIIYDTSATEIKKVTKSNLNFTSPGKSIAFSLIFG
jgi:hypothetical protein